MKEERVSFQQNFIDNHYNITFKYHNSLGLSGFGELIIDNQQYTSDPCFVVLDKHKPLRINISTNKMSNCGFFSTSLT